MPHARSLAWARDVQRSLASRLPACGWRPLMHSRILRAKHGWHMRSADFVAPLRITPPHQTHTTFDTAPPLPASAPPV